MSKYKNSNSTKCDIDQMANVILMKMNAYKYVTVEAMQSAVNNTAKEAVKELKTVKPEGSEKYGSWDDYRKGWTATRNNKKGGSYRYDMVVHNKTHYRLAHLLEKGHAIVTGGRTKGKTRAFKHIEPIEQMCEDLLVDNIIHELERNL